MVAMHAEHSVMSATAVGADLLSTIPSSHTGSRTAATAVSGGGRGVSIWMAGSGGGGGLYP